MVEGDVPPPRHFLRHPADIGIDGGRSGPGVEIDLLSRSLGDNRTPVAGARAGLDGGTSGATNPTLRRMTKGTSFITYGLYGDAARTQPWFNTTAFYRAGGTGTGLAQSFNVYGRIPVQTTPPQGVYSDNVVVTVTY